MKKIYPVEVESLGQTVMMKLNGWNCMLGKIFLYEIKDINIVLAKIDIYVVFESINGVNSIKSYNCEY